MHESNAFDKNSVHLVDVDRFVIVNLHIQQVPLDELLLCVVIPCVQQGLMGTKGVCDGLYTPVVVMIDTHEGYVCSPLPSLNMGS